MNEECLVDIQPQESIKAKRPNFLRIIRLKCLDCCCGSAREVKLCDVKTCPNWKYRFGTDPDKQKRSLSDEEKLERTARLHNVKKFQAIRIESMRKKSAQQTEWIYKE